MHFIRGMGIMGNLLHKCSDKLVIHARSSQYYWVSPVLLGRVLFDVMHIQASNIINEISSLANKTLKVQHHTPTASIHWVSMFLLYSIAQWWPTLCYYGTKSKCYKFWSTCEDHPACFCCCRLATLLYRYSSSCNPFVYYLVTQLWMTMDHWPVTTADWRLATDFCLKNISSTGNIQYVCNLLYLW